MHTTARSKAELGQLGRLAAAGRAVDEQDLVACEVLGERCPAGGDGQVVGPLEAGLMPAPRRDDRLRAGVCRFETGHARRQVGRRHGVGRGAGEGLADLCETARETTPITQQTVLATCCQRLETGKKRGWRDGTARAAHGCKAGNTRGAHHRTSGSMTRMAMTFT